MPTAESVVRPHAVVPLSTTDRREYSRAALEGPVLIDSFSAWQRGRSENVSLTGVALNCDAPLPLGKTVEVYFELPNGVGIEALARVVRAAGQRAALAFLSLDRRAELALRAYCHGPAAAR